ncbi:MAG: DNA-3-methyladenine glycosylase I [Phycisphaerales bacterium]
MPDPAAHRCPWPGSEPRYVAYHDEDWGVPEHDPRALWEKLVLDGFQAGLSWWVILKKRDDFRRAFEGFRPEVVATWGEPEIERLVVDATIVRSRSKIVAAIQGARAWMEIEATHPGGFHAFIWRYVDGSPLINAFATADDVPTRTPASEAMAKDLKRAGFNYCGPVICYAFMQAVGMVNDHLTTCFRHAECAAMAER